MQKAIATTLAISLAISGCATSSANIAASYATPIQYQGYDCTQLAAEAQRIHGRVNQLAGRLDEAASNDKMIMGVGVGVGMVLFWPALFALGGTKQQEADYARLKGEYDAIQQAMIAKKCEQGTAPASTANAAGAVNAAPVATPANPSTPPEPGR